MNRKGSRPKQPATSLPMAPEQIASMYPNAASGVIEHEIDDDLVLYDPRTDAVHVLNETAAAVWWLCDGQRSGDGIAAEIARLFMKPEHEVKHEVFAAIQELLGGCAVFQDAVSTNVAVAQQAPHAHGTNGHPLAIE